MNLKDDLYLTEMYLFLPIKMTDGLGSVNLFVTFRTSKRMSPQTTDLSSLEISSKLFTR